MVTAEWYSIQHNGIKWHYIFNFYYEENDSTHEEWRCELWKSFLHMWKQIVPYIIVSWYISSIWATLSLSLTCCQLPSIIFHSTSITGFKQNQQEKACTIFQPTMLLMVRGTSFSLMYYIPFSTGALQGLVKNTSNMSWHILCTMNSIFL